jgi:hypothetical protein
MKKIVKLTESDLVKIVKRVLTESNSDLYTMAITRVKKNPQSALKAVNSYKPTNQEEANDKSFYITFIDSVKGGEPMTPSDYIGKRLGYNMKLFNLLPL